MHIQDNNNHQLIRLRIMEEEDGKVDLLRLQVGCRRILGNRLMATIHMVAPLKVLHHNPNTQVALRSRRLIRSVLWVVQVVAEVDRRSSLKVQVEMEVISGVAAM